MRHQSSLWHEKAIYVVAKAPTYLFWSSGLCTRPPSISGAPPVALMLKRPCNSHHDATVNTTCLHYRPRMRSGQKFPCLCRRFRPLRIANEIEFRGRALLTLGMSCLGSSCKQNTTVLTQSGDRGAEVELVHAAIKIFLLTGFELS